MLTVTLSMNVADGFLWLREIPHEKSPEDPRFQTGDTVKTLIPKGVYVSSHAGRSPSRSVTGLSIESFRCT
jgi:hypothetical protein